MAWMHQQNNLFVNFEFYCRHRRRRRWLCLLMRYISFAPILPSVGPYVYLHFTFICSKWWKPSQPDKMCVMTWGTYSDTNSVPETHDARVDANAVIKTEKKVVEKIEIGRRCSVFSCENGIYSGFSVMRLSDRSHLFLNSKRILYIYILYSRYMLQIASLKSNCIPPTRLLYTATTRNGITLECVERNAAMRLKCANWRINYVCKQCHAFKLKVCCPCCVPCIARFLLSARKIESFSEKKSWKKLKMGVIRRRHIN